MYSTKTNMPVIKILLGSKYQVLWSRSILLHIFFIMNNWICLWWLCLSTATAEYKPVICYVLLNYLLNLKSWNFSLNFRNKTLELPKVKQYWIVITTTMLWSSAKIFQSHITVGCLFIFQLDDIQHKDFSKRAYWNFTTFCI